MNYESEYPLTIKQKRVIIFDLDNTLIDTRRSRRERYNQLITRLVKEKKIHSNKHKKSLNTLLSISDTLTLEERFTRFARTYTNKLTAHKEGTRIKKMYQGSSAEKYLLFPACTRTLKWLSRNYSLHIITHGNRRVQKHKLAQTGIAKFIQKTIIVPTSSKKIKAIQTLIHRLKTKGFDPQNVVYVDDGEQYVRFARQEGIRALLFNPRGRSSQNTITALTELQSITTNQSFIKPRR